MKSTYLPHSLFFAKNSDGRRLGELSRKEYKLDSFLPVQPFPLMAISMDKQGTFITFSLAEEISMDDSYISGFSKPLHDSKEIFKRLYRS